MLQFANRTGPRLILALLTLPIAASCRRAPSLSYTVALDRPVSDTVRVTIELAGVPRDSLVLRAHASREVLTPVGLRIASREGIQMKTRVGFVASGSSTQPAEVARVVAPGPLPSVLHVSYSVAVNRREGDPHLGFTGTSVGEVNDRFGLLAGRSIFLVPEPATALERIDVGFAL